MSSAASPIEVTSHVRSRSTTLPHNIVLWLVLFFICLGLGYPTLNRYDPRRSLPDAAVYATLAREGPAAVESHMRFRVLVPYLARPLYKTFQGYTGSWDPLMLAFLVVNAFFSASTALLLLRIGNQQFGNPAIALAGTLLYLLNFAVANLRLAGLVDAAEGFFLLALIAALLWQRLWLLPVLGIVAPLAKESFIPLSLAMAIAWCASEPPPRRLRTAAAIGWMAFLELLALTLLQYFISRQLTWPWTFALSLNSHSNYATNLLRSLVDRNFWYIFLWLLPLGLARLGRFSRPWVWAAAAGSAVAFLLNSYYAGDPGTAGRAVFSTAGPLLSLSAGSFLCSQISFASPLPDDLPDNPHRQN